MSIIKVETTEDSIDEMNTSMQHLIEQADWLLNNIENRSSNSIIRSTFDESSRSSNQNSMNAYIAEQEAVCPEPEQEISIVSTSSPPSHDGDNESSGSDTTIVCGSEEPAPGPSNSSPTVFLRSNNSFIPQIIQPMGHTFTQAGPSNRTPMIIFGSHNSLGPGVIRSLANNSLVYCNQESTPQSSNRTPGIVMTSNSPDQEVIVIGTPTVQHPRRRRARRNGNVRNLDDSVIDLSNYQEMRPGPPSESIIVLSSDEENDEAAEVVVTAQQPPAPAANRNITINSFGVSVEASSPQSISVVLTDRRRNRNRTNDTIGQFYDAGRINMVEPLPAPPQGIATNAGSPAATKTMIICPICYETLVNQPAVSTSCGHVFCSQCITLSLRTAKKCPICNKKLIRPSQLHPVYFATG